MSLDWALPVLLQLKWDQAVLKSILWPELLRTGDVMTHDSYLCDKFNNTRPWPSQRANMTEFVGSQYTRNKRTVLKECPLACRPPNHKNWKYCWGLQTLKQKSLKKSPTFEHAFGNADVDIYVTISYRAVRNGSRTVLQAYNRISYKPRIATNYCPII